MYIGLHVKFALHVLCYVLMKCEFSGQIFITYPIFQFHENSFRGRRIVSCGQTDMTKPIISFHDFAKAPKSS